VERHRTHRHERTEHDARYEQHHRKEVSPSQRNKSQQKSF
jgi:hypothetical protein